MLKLNMNRVSIHATIGVAVVSGLVLMPFLVKPALADDVCYQETVNGSGSTGSNPIYQLNSDCTLHIGPGYLPKIDKYNNGDDAYPIKQHDKVKRIVFDDPIHTRLNDDSSYLFDSYPNVESIEGIDKLDVSHVMQFADTFAGLDLKEPADLSSWNVSTAWNFRAMFQGSNLNGFKGIDKFTFDLSNRVQWFSRDFQRMFKDTTSTKGIDLSGWKFLNPNESNGVMFGSMFDGASTPKIDVSSFSDLDIGTGAMGMFANTNTDIEGLDRFPAQTMTDSTRMFENAKPTNQVDLSSWNTENLKEAAQMFRGSNIDKFSGMDHWNLQALSRAVGMYANLNPSHEIRIQPQMPNLGEAIFMFYESNLDMFPDIDNLQLPASSITNIFDSAKANYLSVANWKNGSNTSIAGMLASPYIKFATFGNKTIGNDYTTDFFLLYSRYLFGEAFTGQNVWDDPNLPKEYSAKKWATLPIKPDCDTQFDGNPDNLPKNCWDDNQSWVSDKTGVEADEELLDNTTKHYQRIFFRLETIPVNFNANGVENIQGLPNSYSFDRLYKNNEGLIPNNTPVDPSGAREFLSWNTQADGKGKTYHPGDHVGHDIQSLDLYAQWKDKAPKVQFNNNGGEGPTPETKPATDDNTKIAVDCTSTPSKDGSTFIGWSKTKNDVLEGSDAGEKGNIDVCGYSDKKIVKGLAGKTIDLYATWAKRPQAFFKENRPKDMTALLPATKTITGNWVVDDSTPRTYVAPNIEGWNKGYSPDGVYRFDGWTNDDGTPFTGAYLDREDITINAKWSRIAPAENHNHDNDNNDQNNHDNGNTDDNNGDTVDDNANTNASNNGADNNSNSGSDTTNNQQNSINRPGTTPIISSNDNQETDSSPLLDPTPEGSSDASVEPATGNGSESAADDTGSSSSQYADTSEVNNLAKTGVGIIAPIVLIITSIVGATAAIAFSRTRSRKQQ